MKLETWQVIVVVVAPVFGIFYNMGVAWLEKQQVEGETSLLVATGCAATIALSIPFVGWENAGWVLALFVLTGVPMIIGSKWRYLKEMKQAREEAKVLAQRLTEVQHDQTESQRL